MKLTDFTTLANAQAHFDKTDVSIGNIIEHDARFDVETIMNAILADDAISNELRISARVFLKLLNGILPEVEIWTATVQGALYYLVTDGRYTQAMRNHIENFGKTYPFLTVTPVQFADAHAALDIVKQEATYPGEIEYIITTDSQGVDVEIDTDIDAIFDLYLDVCADSDDQNQPTNFRKTFSGKSVAFEQTENGKTVISLCSRKLRQFNKLFVKPRTPCNFTAVARVNRG